MPFSCDGEVMEEETTRVAADVADRVGGVAGLAPALQQRDLEVVERGEVVVADAQGAGEVGVGGEQLLAAGETEDFADGQLVLGADRERQS